MLKISVQYVRYYNIRADVHLLPSLEGDMKICSTQGNMNFLCWTKFHVSRLNELLIVYYTESWRRTYYQGSMHRIEVLPTLAFHSYYDIIALAATDLEQCRETRQGDTMPEGRHNNLSSLYVTALDHISLFVISILWGIIIVFCLNQLTDNDFSSLNICPGKLHITMSKLIQSTYRHLYSQV